MNRFPIAGGTVAAALFGGALALRWEVLRAPAIARIGLQQPIPVVTTWGAYGALLLATLALAIAVASWGYLQALRAIARDRRASLGMLLALIALGLLAAAAAPVLFSSDVYAYAAYGEMARRGLAVYGHAPLPLSDPLFRLAAWQWSNPPPVCIYGPLFVGLAAGVVALAAPFGPLGQLTALRLLAGLSLLLLAAAVWLAYPGERTARLRAAALIGLNPVAIWCAAEGHNDALALALAMIGIALVRRGFGPLGGAIAALGGWIKLPALLAAAAVRERTTAYWPALAVAALAIASAIPMLYAAAHYAGHAAYAPQASLQALIATALPIAPAAVVVALAGAAAAASAGYGLARLRAGSAAGWSWLVLGGWMLVPNPYPWYGLWLLAAAALAPGGAGAVALIGLALTGLARYAPDAIGTPSPLGRLVLALVACAPLLPALVQSAIIGRSHDRRHQTG